MVYQDPDEKYQMPTWLEDKVQKLMSAESQAISDAIDKEESQLAQAQSKFERRKKLVETATNVKDLEAAESAVHEAKAELDKAEQRKKYRRGDFLKSDNQHATSLASEVSQERTLEPNWNLKKPKRLQGYIGALYQELREAHAAVKEKPTVDDILAAFRGNKPANVCEVIGSEKLTYYTENSPVTKVANRRAIAAAISRMTR